MDPSNIKSGVQFAVCRCFIHCNEARDVKSLGLAMAYAQVLVISNGYAQEGCVTVDRSSPGLYKNGIIIGIARMRYKCSLAERYFAE